MSDNEGEFITVDHKKSTYKPFVPGSTPGYIPRPNYISSAYRDSHSHYVPGANRGVGGTSHYVPGTNKGKPYYIPSTFKDPTMRSASEEWELVKHKYDSPLTRSMHMSDDPASTKEFTVSAENMIKYPVRMLHSESSPRAESSPRGETLHTRKEMEFKPHRVLNEMPVKKPSFEEEFPSLNKAAAKPVQTTLKMSFAGVATKAPEPEKVEVIKKRTIDLDEPESGCGSSAHHPIIYRRPIPTSPVRFNLDDSDNEVDINDIEDDDDELFDGIPFDDDEDEEEDDNE